MDPRWERPNQGSNRETSSSPNRPAAGQVQRLAHHGPPSASPSFNQKDISISIVFSASWVHITTPIGEGAFSRVYEGVYKNPETGDQSIVAVKVLKKNMLKRRSDCLRFIKEAKIMTKISHPNIAACYGIGKYDDDDEQNPGSLFIVQELIKGGNLLHKVYKQMLNRQKCIYSSLEALAWMMNVAEGMQYLHAVSDVKPMIIHRDLKLENIMLCPWGAGTTAKLVDFGLHKVIDDRIKKVVKRVASEAYLGSRLGLRRVAANATEGEEEDDGPAEEEDELEVALAQQRAEKAKHEGSSLNGSLLRNGSSPEKAEKPAGVSFRDTSGERGIAEESSSPRSRVAGRGAVLRAQSRLHLMATAMEAHKEEDEEELALQEAAEAKQQSPSPDATAGIRSSSSRGDDMQAEASRRLSQADPKERLRAPPKKQNSMQKLMAKMKEIKLRVTGRLGETSPPLSQQPSQVGHEAPAAAASPALTPEAVEAKEKMARNEALLDHMLAQRSPDHNGDKSNTADDLGLVESPAAQRARKGPPRRAVTWVNEVRYNLTEAVGSWAYMAPEVVLGQPYNEKVDVFSFGVILFEVLNRKLMLVDEIKNDPRKDAQAYAERVARGFRPEIPKRWPPELAELITACWAQDPHVRPNFTAVVDILKELDSKGLVSKLDVGFFSNGSVYI